MIEKKKEKNYIQMEKFGCCAIKWPKITNHLKFETLANRHSIPQEIVVLSPILFQFFSGFLHTCLVPVHFS